MAAYFVSSYEVDIIPVASQGNYITLKSKMMG